MTEKHLILAILAFECDLIDLEQLSAACRAWAEDKSRPLIELLLLRGWINAEDRVFLEKQLERKLAKYQHDPRVTLNSIVRGDVCDALKSVNDSEISNSLSSWPSAAPVLIESISGIRTAANPSESRYTWVSEVGKGGLGRVWLARDNDLAREVALKEIKPDSASNEAVRRLIKEAQITGQLQHPNIVPVYEVNRTGHPFYTMKLVKGETLAAAIQRHHQQRKAGQEDPLSMPRLMGVFINVCDAIAYAHSRGIIHRDLKPNNIVLGDYGEAIVLDWGLARQVGTEDEETAPVALTDDARTDATRAGAMLGTPAYMAPEQALGRVDLMDQRTDIYGLGAILFELLTGKPPHRISSNPENESESANNSERKATTFATLLVDPLAHLLRRITTEEPPRVRELRAEIPDELDSICARAMARKRDARFQSAKDLKAALLDFRVHERSIELTADAATDLANAKQESDYSHFNRALYGFEEALRQWPENARAAEGVLETETAYAQAAFERGDFDLALSHLNPATPVNQDLRDSIQQAVKERESRKERIKRLRRLARKRRKIAERERLNAISALKVAESAQQEEAKHRAFAELKADEERNARVETEATLARSNFFLARSRWEQERLAEADEILELVPEQHRHWEWYYSKRQFAGSDVTLYGHARLVTCVTYSPDGKYIASASTDKTVKLWDAYTGNELHTLCGHTNGVTWVCFSPDGQRIASSSRDKTIIVWDLSTRTQLQTFTGHTDTVTCVTYSPNGKWLGSASNDATIKIWDLNLNIEQRTLSGHNASVRSVIISPDGMFLASASGDGTTKIWNVSTCLEHRVLTGDKSGVNCVAFSPDGKYLATASSTSIKIWDALRGSEVRTFIGHKNGINCVCFSPDGQSLASASADEKIKIWQQSSADAVHTFAGHSGNIVCLTYSPDGQCIVSASVDHTIKVWDARRRTDFGTFASHRFGVESVTFSPNNEILASASGDRTIKLWNSQNGTEMGCLIGHRSRVKCLSFSPDGHWLASASSDKTVKLWRLHDDANHRVLSTGMVTVNAVAFSRTGLLLASGSSDKTIKLWDTRSGMEVLTLSGHTDEVTSVAFSPSGRRIASGSRDKTLNIWDTRSGELLLSVQGHTGGVSSVAFSHDGKVIASASSDRSIKLWDAEDAIHRRVAIELQTLLGHTGEVKSLSFTQDGLRLASASSDSTIKLWDVSTGYELRTLTGHSKAVTSVGFSPDFQSLISASEDHSIRLWDVRDGDEILSFHGHSMEVLSVSFSPDGKLIASASRDKSVKLWNAQNGEELRTLITHAEEVRSVCFSPDGQWLASASQVLVQSGIHGKSECRTLTGHRSRVNSVAFSRDGNWLASAGGDTQIKLWDAHTGTELVTFSGHKDEVTCVSVCPEGSRLASASWDRTIKLWDVNRGEEICTLIGHSREVTSVAFSPDGRWLASASFDKSVRIWDAQTGIEVRCLMGHKREVASLAFSPDGMRLASAGMDNAVKLWDVCNGIELMMLDAHSNDIRSICFSPNGARFAAAGADNLVKLWSNYVDTKVRLLCADPKPVLNIEFSPDSEFLFVRHADGSHAMRSVSSGELIDSSTQHFSTTFNELGCRSPNGNWLATTIANRIRLIDVSPASDADIAYWDFKTRLDPAWHGQQAVNAEASQTWFAIAFYRTWLVKAEPSNIVALNKLRNALLQIPENSLIPIVTIQLYQEWNQPIPTLTSYESSFSDPIFQFFQKETAIQTNEHGKIAQVDCRYTVIDEDGFRFGPIDENALRLCYHKGQLTGDSFVCDVVAERWIELRNLFDLSQWGDAIEKGLFLSGRVRVVIGDITKQHVDAIVNMAKSSLLDGVGINGTIHAAGGPDILRECRQIRQTTHQDGLPVGGAVITRGGKLFARYVIHTVGPIKNEHVREEELLSNCYLNSIQIAAEHECKSIAFPSISTGAYGYPPNEAARIASLAIAKALLECQSIQEVRLVFYSTDAAEMFVSNAEWPNQES